MVQFRAWRENTLRSEEDYGFHTPYLLGCAAFRIPPFRWQDEEVRHDTRIQEFMQRVKISVVTDEKDFSAAKHEDPRTFQMRITLVAKGKTFEENIPYTRGSAEPAEYRNTDQELMKKFVDNASRILPAKRAKAAAQRLLQLEKVDDISLLMNMVAP